MDFWSGTLDDLRSKLREEDMEASSPAEGDRLDRRRPLMETVMQLCEDHADYHSNVVPELREKWGE